MSVLFGHPTGNPNSHNAGLAHFESGRLEAFCVPWMPTPGELRVLSSVPGLDKFASRLGRRFFAALAGAPKIEGRAGEWSRMARRVLFGGRFASEGLSYEANDWLMRTMRSECRRKAVTAVHAYEDCSAWSFEEAKRLGKACIYDLPIGYYPAWERRQRDLVEQHFEWLPAAGLPAKRFVRPEQKVREMELADLILVPCTFVKKTVAEFADKPMASAPYGVDLEFWNPGPRPEANKPLRFIYAGQCSLRKGIPTILEAWRRAEIPDADLELVGPWLLAEEKLHNLPAKVKWRGPISASDLRTRYQASDVFVFPSYFEGFGLVILEAMACGLPVIATEATAGPDVLEEDCGRIFSAGDVDELVALLHWFGLHRESLPAMGAAARARAEQCTWDAYRQKVAAATKPFV